MVARSRYYQGLHERGMNWGEGSTDSHPQPFKIDSSVAEGEPLFPARHLTVLPASRLVRDIDADAYLFCHKFDSVLLHLHNFLYHVRDYVLTRERRVRRGDATVCVITDARARRCFRSNERRQQPSGSTTIKVAVTLIRILPVRSLALFRCRTESC